jgi:hypothetical protein
MRRPALAFVCLLFSAAFFAQTSAPQAAAPDPFVGSVTGTTYTSTFFGFSIEIPKEWGNDIHPDLSRLPEKLRPKYAAELEQVRRQDHGLITAHPAAGWENIATMPLVFVRDGNSPHSAPVAVFTTVAEKI